MVQEYGVKLFIEKLGRYNTFKLVVTEIQELKGRQGQDNHRELPYKTVVTQIKLVEKLHAFKRGRDCSTEPVRVEMEESQISEKTELRR